MAHLAFLQKTQTSLAPLAQASLKHANTLCPIFFYMPPKNLRAPSLRRSESACRSVRKHACKRKRGCISKDAPAGAGETCKYAIPPFLCTPPRGQKRARGEAAPTCAKRKAQRADVRKDEARGRAKGVGGTPAGAYHERRVYHHFVRNVSHQFLSNCITKDPRLEGAGPLISVYTNGFFAGIPALRGYCGGVPFIFFIKTKLCC